MAATACVFYGDLGGVQGCKVLVTGHQGCRKLSPKNIFGNKVAHRWYLSLDLNIGVSPGALAAWIFRAKSTSLGIGGSTAAHPGGWFGWLGFQKVEFSSSPS